MGSSHGGITSDEHPVPYGPADPPTHTNTNQQMGWPPEDVRYLVLVVIKSLIYSNCILHCCIIKGYFLVSNIYVANILIY